MSEWWTYDLADLVLFTPDTYFRMYGLYHLDWWPMQLLAMAIGVFISLRLTLKPVGSARVIVTVLGVSWAWVGWAFLHLRFAPIHWVANWYAIAFGLQATLLLIFGLARNNPEFDPGNSLRTAIGFLFLLGALLLMPLGALLAGREWMQAELFAMTPDSTVLATLGLLLLARERVAVWLLVIPIAWCLVTGATLWALGAPGALILPTAALLAIVLMLMPDRIRRPPA